MLARQIWSIQQNALFCASSDDQLVIKGAWNLAKTLIARRAYGEQDIHPKSLLFADSFQPADELRDPGRGNPPRTAFRPGITGRSNFAMNRSIPRPTRAPYHPIYLDLVIRPWRIAQLPPSRALGCLRIPMNA